MPATYSPTEVEHRPSRVEENDNGNGRRPPTDKRTGGGGDNNDNWNDRPQGSRGPRERLQRYRLGIFFALSGDLMFFIALASVFFVSQSSGHIDAYNHYINNWLPMTIPPLLWINTAVILISSVTMEIARRRMFSETHVMEEWFGFGRPTSRRAMPWLVATVVLGLLFLAGQALAWHQLALQNVFLRANPSSKFFYLITYTHAVHLILGVGLLVAALAGLYQAKRIEGRQILVDCAGWYWHSMGVFWIFLFALLVCFP